MVDRIFTPPVEQFRVAIKDAGIVPPEKIVGDGEIHRFPSNGKAGNDAGWYSYAEGSRAFLFVR